MGNLKKRLKGWRDRAGLTQDQAARVFLVSLQAYRNWEQGRHGPRARAAEDVDAVLRGSERTWSGRRSRATTTA